MDELETDVGYMYLWNFNQHMYVCFFDGLLQNACTRHMYRVAKA